MAKDVEGTHQALASLLAQVQEASRATASLAEVGQAEAARVAASVVKTAAADRAVDTSRWNDLHRHLDLGRRTDAAILEQRSVLKASSSAE